MQTYNLFFSVLQDSFDTILDPIKYNTYIERGKRSR